MTAPQDDQEDEASRTWESNSVPGSPQDGNDQQRERSENRLRTLAVEEMARVLEGVGIDIKTSEGRRELRTRLDYLDRLFDDQTSNRAALDWAREMMTLNPSVRTVMAWATAKMRVEDLNRDAMRKTVVEKTTGGVLWLLVGGLLAALIGFIAKGHLP